MNDKRKAYEEKLDAQLNEWDAQIALLKAKAENAVLSGYGTGLGECQWRAGHYSPNGYSAFFNQGL